MPPPYSIENFLKIKFNKTSFIGEFDVQKKGDPSNWIFEIEDRHDTTTRWHGMAGMNERGREEGKMRTRATAEAHLILTVLSSTHSSQIVLIVR